MHYYISTDLCALVLCGADESLVELKGKRGNLHWVADQSLFIRPNKKHVW